MAKGNILVIDDELVMREFLRDLLSEQGYAVKEASSGQDGIKILKEGKYDIVLCDLKMPDMDGIKVLEKAKEIDPNIVFIIVTGYPTFETIKAALRLGGFDYVTKPFDIKEVSSVLERAIAFRRLTVANEKMNKRIEENNIRLDKETSKGRGGLDVSYKVKDGISPTLKLDDIFEVVLDRICRILDFEKCSVLLVNKGSGELIINASRGLDSEIVAQTKLKLGEPISGWITQHKQAVLVEDIETDERFAKRSQEKYYTKSFIGVPLIVKEEAIGVVNINNKKSKEPFTQDDFRFLKGVVDVTAIAVENAMLYASLEVAYLDTVMALGSAIGVKNQYTKGHLQQVTKYSLAIAKEMGLSDDEIKVIDQACHLYDLGNLWIQEYILTKQGKLTTKEWEEIKLHTVRSAEMLRPLGFLDGVIDLVEQHHERYDGMGYPHKLKREEIILGARIIAVADSFDAMISDRPYRKALSQSEAIEELRKGSGTQFDPKVVEAFLRAYKKA